MRSLLAISIVSAAIISAASASASSKFQNGAFTAALGKRQSAKNTSYSLVIDLGYEQYEGVADKSTGINTWKGYVRFLVENKISQI